MAKGGMLKAVLAVGFIICPTRKPGHRVSLRLDNRAFLTKEMMTVE
jgi:hypothetical protein